MKQNIKKILLVGFTVAILIPVVIATNKNIRIEDDSSQADLKDESRLSDAEVNGVSLISFFIKQLNQVNEGKLFTADFKYFDSVNTADNYNGKMSFWKNGHSFYQKLGNAIVINHPDVFVQIDHDGKSIVVSSPDMVSALNTSPYSSIEEMMKDERYRIGYKKSTQGCFIMLENSNHVSTPGLEFGYNCADSSVNSITLFTRSEIRLDTLMPAVQISYSSIEFNSFNYDKYMNYSEFIANTTNGWVLSEKYKEYTLTVLP